MDQGDRSPKKPSGSGSGSRNLFDPANLLGSPPSFSAASDAHGPPFIPLLHMPSAYPMLARPPGFPAIPPFGGLGLLNDPLRSPGALAHLSPTTGGADWWRAASEHARMMASCTGADYYAGSLSPGMPPFGGLTEGASSLDSLYRQSQADKSLMNGLFGFPMCPPLYAPPLSAPAAQSLTATTTTTTTSQAKITSPQASPCTTSSKTATVTKSSASTKFDAASPKAKLPRLKSPTPSTYESVSSKSSSKEKRDSIDHVPLGLNFSSKDRHSKSDYNKGLDLSSYHVSKTSSRDNGISMVLSRDSSISMATSPTYIATTTTDSLKNNSLPSKDYKPASRKALFPSPGSLKDLSQPAEPLCLSKDSKESKTVPSTSENTAVSLESVTANGHVQATPTSVIVSPVRLNSNIDSELDKANKAKQNGEGGSSSSAGSDSDVSSGSSISGGDSGSDSEDDKPLKILTAEPDGSAGSGREHSLEPGEIPRSLGSLSQAMSSSVQGLPSSPVSLGGPLPQGMPTSVQPLPSSPVSLGISPTHPRSLLKPDSNSAFEFVGTGQSFMPVSTRGRGRGRGRSRMTRGRGRGRGLAHRILGGDKETEEQRRKKLELKQRLEAELKKQQLQLKLAKKAAAMREKEAVRVQASRDGVSSSDDGMSGPRMKEQSKLAQALMGHAPLLAMVSGGTSGPSTSKDGTIENGSLCEDGLLKDSSSDDDDDDDLDSNRDQSDDDLGSLNGSSSDGENGADRGSDSYSEKRSADEDGNDIPRKRRRKSVDETEIRIPLEHGWRRETRIRTVGQRGIVGEVFYYAPCGKRLRTYPEVTRYLQKNNITDLMRDNFTFSTKVPVGEFLEARHADSEKYPAKESKSLSGGKTRGQACTVNYVLLSEQEVLDRLMTAQLRRAKQHEKRQLKRARKQEALEMAKRMAEDKLRRRREQQEMARKVAELKLRRKLERQQEREAARQAKQMRAMEVKKLKERQRLMKQQEKLQKQEQMRIEREMRAQQIIEEREMKRQQAFMLKEQERERRRQHMLLVKALEARKKQEERERLKDEKKAEKVMVRERRLEQRRMELEMARELKKPVEDMKLQDTKPLPTFKRIPGVRLSGEAFANCLMVVEFMHNFGQSLNFESHAVPSLDMLQQGLLNEGEATSEMLAFTIQLLRCAVHDPGVPNPKESTTTLGQKIENVQLNDTNVSEVLRIFLKARTNQDDKMYKWLVEKPFQALNPTQKAAVLGFLCNELLCSRAVSGEIESSIEKINNLRRDKWIIEGKMRKLRILQAKKFGKSHVNKSRAGTPGVADYDSNVPTPPAAIAKKKESDDEDENESGHESDNGAANESEEEEEEITMEEIDKKLERLNRQQGQFRGKVFDACHKLRAISFGQDRFKRRYWSLPHMGGIYVEAVESADPEDREIEEDRLLDHEKKEENKKLEKSEEKAGVCKVEVKKELELSPVKKTEPECKDLGTSDLSGQKSEVKQEDSKTEDVKAAIKTLDTLQPLAEKLAQNSSEKCERSAEKVTLNDISTPEPKQGIMDLSKQMDQLPNSSTPKQSVLHLFQPHLGSKTDNDLKPVPVTSAGQSSSGQKPLSPRLTSSHTSTQVLSVPTSTHTIVTSESSPVCPSVSNSLANGGLVKSSILQTGAHTINMQKSTAKTESQSTFRSIDSILGHSPHTTASSGSYSSPSVITSSPFATLAVNFATAQGTWFSILPKMPCDESSITRSPDSPQKSQSVPVASYLSPIAVSPFQGTPGAMISGGSAREAQSISVNTSTPQCSFTANSFNSLFNSSAGGTPGSFQMHNDYLLPMYGHAMPPAQYDEPQPIPRSLQRGWWQIEDLEQFKNLLKCLHPRGIRERNLQRTFQKFYDYVCQPVALTMKDAMKMKESEESKKVGETSLGAPDLDLDGWDADVAHKVEQFILEEIQNTEDRVYHASLQVKGWKLPPKITEDEDIELVRRDCTLSEKEKYTFDAAKERLLELEKNVERRYLKPPLHRNKQIDLNTITTDHPPSPSSEPDEDLPPALMTWRQAVVTATNPAQLALCLMQLDGCIAWEKSIMKVNCQICLKDDNEAMLLLCDGCDKGYHTYCFRPKMEKIPEGDWYCYECVSKASGVPCCVVCGKKVGKLAVCEKCPRAFHMDCLDPPITKIPRKWLCPTCVCEKGKSRSKSKKSKEKERERRESETKNTETPPTTPNEKAGKTTPSKADRKKEGGASSSAEKKKEAANNAGTAASATSAPVTVAAQVPAKLTEGETATCRCLLGDMEKHKDGWPFLTPVNTKQFPTYKKVIKHPMDFTTMRNKLRDQVYKCKADFASDARLVFDNCETFNEDDSEVGQAGHNMRKYFEKKWKDAFPSS